MFYEIASYPIPNMFFLIVCFNRRTRTLERNRRPEHWSFTVYCREYSCRAPQRVPKTWKSSLLYSWPYRCQHSGNSPLQNLMRSIPIFSLIQITVNCRLVPLGLYIFARGFRRAYRRRGSFISEGGLINRNKKGVSIEYISILLEGAYIRGGEFNRGLKGGARAQSTRLPSMWPGFNSQRGRHMWTKSVVGSLLCSERFSGFPLSSKTNFSKFQFD